MISIVTAYYNRRKLFAETLKSIAKSAYEDYELIAVDDASDDNERIEDLQAEFPFLKVTRVEKKDKWYVSSVMPFNMAIAKATGDIILLQNPECYHVHDVLSYVAKTVSDSNYVTMSAYSLNKELTEAFPTVNKMDFFESSPQQHVEDYIGWYNHSIYNPTYFHFCAAMTKKNMDELGGFDERFANGIGYEDNDLVNRIIRLRLNKIICDDVSVIHQWHPKVYDLVNKTHLSYWYLNTFGYKIIENETVIKVKNRYK